MHFGKTSLALFALFLGCCKSDRGFDGNIKNVVVTVLENRFYPLWLTSNRSFDTIMGFFNYSQKLDGIPVGGICQHVDARNKSSQCFCTNPNLKHYVNLNPGHKLAQMSYEIYGHDVAADTPISKLPKVAPMDAYVDYHKNIKDLSDEQLQDLMSSFNPESIPVIHTLSREFAVFNRWFASFPGETLPNRAFVHANTAGGLDVNWTYRRILCGGLHEKTMWETLTEKGVSWRNYWAEIPTMLYYRNLRRKQYSNNFSKYRHFVADALEGKLPAVTFTDPVYGETFPWTKSYENDGHAQFGYSDFGRTEDLLKEMYEALRASPQWENLAWIITFDENGIMRGKFHVGGFPDHVAPPAAPRPDNITSDGGFLYDRLGVRVPTIIVSPWVKRGRVVLEDEGVSDSMPTGEFEHSSIASTIFKMLGIDDELSNRTAWSRKFDFLFNERHRARTDCPESVDTVQVKQKRDIYPDRRARQLEAIENKTVDAYFDFEGGSGNPFVEMFQRDVLGDMTKGEQIEFRRKNM